MNIIDLNAILGDVALNLSLCRKMDRFLEDKYKFLGMIPSDPAEMISDWYNACTFIASMLLDGGLNLVDDIGPDLYWFLEEKWLDEVKQLNAYFRWTIRAMKGEQGSKEIDYYIACEQLQEKLIDTKIKASINDFQIIKNYLEDCYLTNGRVNDNKPKVNELVNRKAHRIWQFSTMIEKDEHWYRAKRYINIFYENIIPAVVERNQNNISKIIEALFLGSSENFYPIINSFEAALPILFFDNSISQSILKNA